MKKANFVRRQCVNAGNDLHVDSHFCIGFNVASLYMDQVLFKDGVFQWKRLENLIILAREQVTMMNRNLPLKQSLRAPTNDSRYRSLPCLSGYTCAVSEIAVIKDNQYQQLLGCKDVSDSQLSNLMQQSSSPFLFVLIWTVVFS